MTKMTRLSKTKGAGLRAVDLFAGWGGFTEGAEQAGIEVVYAANHWPLAVEAHAKNHPSTVHECQDLRQANWSALPSYDILFASPSCQGHSRAARPARSNAGHIRYKHDELRATCWAVIDCVEVTHPRAILVENVVEFRKWNKYDLWLEALRREGYHVQEAVVNASRFGVPQLRNRLFISATLRPFDLSKAAQGVDQRPGFGPHIDWDLGRWRRIADCRRPGARARFEAARRLGRATVQHVSLSTRAKAATGLPLDEPLRTITTKDQWCVVDGDHYRPFLIREYARGMGFRDHYGWPEGATRGDVIKGLGNAVCPPVACALSSAMAEAA
jgi:DNA (cytosine-5)-methyltransferase 1